jgi:hypothetical protein
MPVPQAADAGSVDVAMLRRSWGALIAPLGQLRQPILRAVLESATVASFDGETLELAFPPDKRFGVQKVQDRQDELQQALGDLFGIVSADHVRRAGVARARWLGDRRGRRGGGNAQRRRGAPACPGDAGRDPGRRGR